MCVYIYGVLLSSFMILTAQKMKFCVKDFFSKCDQIRSFLYSVCQKI